MAGWPAVLFKAGATADAGPAVLEAALRRIREERLYWPAPRARAGRPRAIALDGDGMAEALARYAAGEVALLRDPADIDPYRLEAVFSGRRAPPDWLALSGLTLSGAPRACPIALLGASRAVSPWTGEALTLDDAIEAQSLLRAAASRAAGPMTLHGMSPWKRRNLKPFLTGPDGPPRRARRDGMNARSVVWGAAEAGPSEALRVEDGFLRSVGLGVRHTPPSSLVLSSRPLHFDATRRNGFEELVERTHFTPSLLARAAALRTRVVTLGLTKYNLEGVGAPPDTGGREAVLAPGQVEDDASIRFGARSVRGNLALLAATRARFPAAFILYKPHPDVLTGRRAGVVPPEEALRHADAIATDMPVHVCLDWADRLATITSLTGFEALLRGKAVTTFGRPFYAGWGLTDDDDPPPRARRLSLDELTAAALILYPRYIDPVTRLPAPPEIVIEALRRERMAAGRPSARARRIWRGMMSWIMNRL